MYPPIIFLKKNNGFIGVMVLTLVMTSLLVEREMSVF